MKTLAISLLLVNVSTFIHAQSPVEADTTTYFYPPVIVSPTQARERETPATFSDIDKSDLEERYTVQDIPVLLSELPSATFYSEGGNGIGYNYVTLRGFDQRRLSVMINGVPQNDPEDHNVYWVDFPDLLASTDQIQVQRGAGSAFYGPPAIGGSINLITNPFTRKRGGMIESMLGFQEFGGQSTSLNTQKHTISLNSGLIGEQYMLYGRLGRLTTDGYRDRSWVRMTSYFLGALRVDENMTTRFHAFGGPIRDGLAYYGVPKFANSSASQRRENLVYWEADSTGSAYSLAIPRRTDEKEHFSQPHFELLHDWNLSPTLTLHNTFFYVHGDGFFDYDPGIGDTSTLRLGTAYGIPIDGNLSNVIVRASVTNNQWGWLPRVEIDHGTGNLTLGAELRLHRSLHHGTIPFAEGLPVSYNHDYRFYEYNGEKDIASIFAHELYRLSEQLTLMTDVQLVYNRYGLKNEKYLGNTFNVDYFFVNPRVGLNLNVTDTWNSYVSFAYTSREPRLKNLYTAEESFYGVTPQFAADTSGGVLRYDFTNPLAKPEGLFDVEIGARYRGERSRISISAFWMEFNDELVKSGQVDIFGQPVTGNAKRTRHLGLEVDGSIHLVDRLSVSGNFSLSRNRHIRYEVFDDAGQFASLDGNPIAGFPDVLGNMRFSYRTEPLTLSYVFKYVGAFYTDNFKDGANKNDAFSASSIEVLGQMPVIMGTNITLRGEVRNLFNRFYTMGGEGSAFFPAAERNYVIGLSLAF